MSSAGFSVEFVPLQPEPDATSSEGGWAKVLLWLKNHPPDQRVPRFFKRGLFGGGLDTKHVDGIVVQLDSDILGNNSFGAYVKKQHGCTVANPVTAEQRADEVRRVLSLAARFLDMTKAEVSRHVLAPAVEAAETWCVAAFSSRHSDFESLSRQDLVDQFMCALEKSESRIPKPPYKNVNKSPDRRSRFCEAYASQSRRVIDGCPRFRETHNQLHALAESIGLNGKPG